MTGCGRSRAASKTRCCLLREPRRPDDAPSAVSMPLTPALAESEGMATPLHQGARELALSTMVMRTPPRCRHRIGSLTECRRSRMHSRGSGPQIARLGAIRRSRGAGGHSMTTLKHSPIYGHSTWRVVPLIVFTAIVGLADALLVAWWIRSTWGMAVIVGATLGLMLFVVWALRRA